MSIPVELSGLQNVMSRYRFAYLMTTNGKDAPHAVAVSPVLSDGELVIAEAGRRTRENAQARPTVGLVWPPQAEGDYSLIVDGQATLSDDGLRIRPTRAVLHRPAVSDRPSQPGACGADCIEISLEAREPLAAQ